jgi:hypothetical protein
LVGLDCVFELFTEVIHDFLEGFEEGNLIFFLEGDIEGIKQLHLVENLVFEGSKAVNLQKRLRLAVRVQFGD